MDRSMIKQLGTILAALTVLASASPAGATPAFARRYETSCQTCHTVFPALTPFGEAFRGSGYRFPMGEDEDRSMDEPVALGQAAHKYLFPDEVWPGTLPGKVPISFVISPKFGVARGEGGGHHGGTPAVMTGGGHGDPEPYALNFKGSSLAILVATPLGDHFNVFAKVEVNGAGEVNLERPFIGISPLKDPSLMMIRVGAFEPSLYPFTIHRSLTGHKLNYTTVLLGDNPWAPEPQQIGIEAAGVAFGRMGWSVGVVEGAGGFNKDKDVYGRLEYKVGGMSLDGTDATGFSRPWQEKSVIFGGSYYRGVASFGDEVQSDAFWRAGADIYARIVDASLTFAGFYQEHQRPVYGDPRSGNLIGALAQFDYIIFPWLVPTVRYEMFRQDLPDAGGAVYGHRGLLGVNALLRANIVLRLFATGRIDNGNTPQFEEVSLALQAAF